MQSGVDRKDKHRGKPARITGEVLPIIGGYSGG